MKDFITESQSEFREELIRSLESAATKRHLAFLENSKYGDLYGGKSLTASWEIYDEFDPTSRAILIAKFQQTSGTTEEKIPFEVIRALEFLLSNKSFKKVWIVLGGFGWNENFINFIEKRLHLWIPEMVGRVQIIVRKSEYTLTDFSIF
jgi:hypothetical protein